MENLELTEGRLKTVINNVACTLDGLELLGHFLSRACLTDTSFNGNSKDIYLKGRRDFVVEEIQQPLINYALNKYIELLRKDEEEKKKNDSSR